MLYTYHPETQEQRKKKESIYIYIYIYILFKKVETTIEKKREVGNKQFLIVVILYM